MLPKKGYGGGCGIGVVMVNFEVFDACVFVRAVGGLGMKQGIEEINQCW